MFSRVLIANRGEIACRVIRACRSLGVSPVTVYSEADAGALHCELADAALPIGPAPARESYLSIPALIAAARESGAEAVHPGYGFLSENAEFAEACAAAGLVFIGPPEGAIRAMSGKAEAKRIAAAAGVPVLPGGALEGDGHAQAAAIGYPLLVKAVAGGGGKGMRRVESAAGLDKALAAARREAASAFGDDRLMLEKLVQTPRHIEVQVFADRRGNAVQLFERDCSVQRRHQKIVEEAPAPGLPAAMRAAIGEAALLLVRAVGYQGAGTVEFVADASEGLRADRIWFLEMNTRLQVEHPVTEAVTGLDLVEWQLRVAAGEALPPAPPAPAGHAIEVRICAEDPRRRFLPSPGRLSRFDLPGDIRVETGLRAGGEVTPWYDSLLAKLIVHAPSRAEACARLADSLALCRIEGVATNVGLLEAVLRHPAFRAGEVDTGFLERYGAELLV